MALLKTSFHTRSISLPSTSHPVDASIEDCLRRLSASQAGPSSSSSVCQNLCATKDLYDQINDSVHFSHNQQVLSHDLHREEVEQVLDGSLALLDGFSSALDALSEMREAILDLQSALRRGNDSEGIHTFLMSRKKISKTVSKCLANLKKAERSPMAQPQKDSISIRMLKEAETTSRSTLKSVLSYVSGRKAISHTRWSLVSKLVKAKQVSCEAENASEVEEIDRVLHSGSKTKDLLKQLETLEMIIHELKDGLESVSRCLVKTRVSLLNVLNH